MLGLNPQEAAFLWAFRRLPDREKHALVNAIERRLAGEPMEDVVTDFIAETGNVDAEEARRRARVVLGKGGEA